MTTPDYQNQIDRAAEAAVKMIAMFRHTTGRAPEADHVRRLAEQVLEMLALGKELLDDVVRAVERQQDISLDGFFVVPPEEESPAGTIWQPVPETPLLRRYLRLLEKEGWSAESRVRLSRVTRNILGRCGNPAVAGEWSRRGMVVGDVQSGKTTSYVSLICAAIDAGYRNIVILGGRTNDLRHQTQERVDLGVTGIESSRVAHAKTKIGVGLIESIPDLITLSLTSQDHVSGNKRAGGDFNKKRATHNNISGSVIRIAVIKKHATMIGHVTDWLRDNGELHTEPLLLIDDEADDASIDTNDPDESPTAINGAIRCLLKAAQRHSYVAYTATPYANVMIDPEARGTNHGEDLFPRDFIALLTPPPTYFGARRFLAEQGSHRRMVDVTDADNWIDSGQVAGPLPTSLKEALREFVIVSAIRRVRRERAGKERQHESMLIHATIRAGAHLKIEDQVRAEMERLQAGWDFPVGEAEIHTQMKDTWKSITQDRSVAASWDDVKPHITDVFDDCRIESINGETKAGLDYRRARNGVLTVIAVGGMKLSRGLTLEGLTTSYHLRTSRQHDTMMQMCRWFGYRTGFEDLCRLHAQPDLFRVFRAIMESDEELRSELEDMAALGASPTEFGIRIRTSPGMTVTARNKLKHAETVRDALAGKTLEVTRTAMKDADHNDALLQDFVRRLGMPREGCRDVWDNVPWDDISEVLEDYREQQSEITGLRGKVFRAVSYINEARKAQPPRLLTWTVALAGRQKGMPEDYGGVSVVRVHRTPQDDDDGILNFGAISDPADEQKARGARNASSRRAVKATRPRDEGLLIIYPIVTDDRRKIRTSNVAISLPNDEELRRHIYTLNPVAQRQAVQG
ncbi:Z1 domain-containing protein [Deinococcus antarcticus]|uniref:Z1 domain-containing protein n=1 Tax=Deinococcus antarcticus TaxID=1298767 RepID=A0ABV8AAR3_9DEIO